MWVMERFEGTESWAYSGINSQLWGLLTVLKLKRAGPIVVYRVNCVGYGAS